MNTQLVDQHWFVSLNGKRYGPYTFAALIEAASKGVITAETNIWRLGWEQWHPARQVPGLLDETPFGRASPDPDAERTDEQRPEIEAEGAALPLKGSRPSQDDVDPPRVWDRRPPRDEFAPRDARNAARSRQASDGEAADAPRSKTKRPDPDEDDARDLPRARNRWSASDDAPPDDTRTPRDKRPSRGEDATRDAVRLRDRRALDTEEPEEDVAVDMPKRDKRPPRSEGAPRDAVRARDRRALDAEDPEEDIAVDTPKPRDKRPSRGEGAPRDALRPRDRRASEPDEEAPPDTPTPRDQRRSRSQDIARDSATLRDRGSPDHAPDAVTPRARRPARDDDAPRAARRPDRWSRRDEDGGAATAKLGDRHGRDADEDSDEPTPTRQRALEDEEADSDAPRLRGARPSRDDDDIPRETARPRNRRPSRDDDATLDTPRLRDRGPSRDDDAPLDTPRLRGRRPSWDEDAPGDEPKRQQDRRLPGDEADDAPHDEWGLLDVRPTADDDSLAVVPRFGRERTPKPASLDDTRSDVAPSRLSRKTSADKVPTTGRWRRFGKRVVVALLVIFVLAGAAWALFASGLIGAGWDLFVSRLVALVEPVMSNRGAESKPSVAAGQPSAAPASGLPAMVVNLPAVVALQRADPASFDRFKKRFAGSAVNAQDDEVLSVARAALRKSVKRQLANSPGETLLEITEAYLAYMQGLQISSPESCVALSDESKGARLTSNLAKQFPVQFIRDMSVLERVASINPGTKVTALTADQARSYLETVFNSIRQQPVKSELLGRDKLDPADFQPYCTLVIAFYQAVLEMPRDDKVNLLRYLYATAATDADSDLAK
jgi:hypothetical protein